MNFIKSSGKFRSVSNLADISYLKYVPSSGEVKAVLQIAHGMAEHKERYEKFADFLCSIGVAVYINDHLGHGESVSSKEELGYFGEMSYNALVDDCKKLTEIAKEDYPAIPYFVFGHSMGSFIMRCYLAKYGDKVDAAIICGTGGSNPACGMGIAITKLISKFKGGDHYRSQFVDNLAFSAYGKKTENRTKFDWLTKDTDVVDEYIADELSGFLFTNNGFVGLFNSLKNANSQKCYDNTPNIPILLIAGECDPVGAYGKGVKQVYDKLKKSHNQVEIKLYPNARHEILNESDTVQTVYKDIEDFIAKQL